MFHIGAHCTGQDALIRSLLKNRDQLSAFGVVVPGPGRYRKVISEAMQKLRGQIASEEAEDVLLEAVLDTDAAERVFLSNESFICMASKVMEDGGLYQRMGKSAWLRNAFPRASVEFCLSIRNFATFLPALYDKLGGRDVDPVEFMAGADPRDLSWFDVVAELRAANPGHPITVWCDEDTPFLWPEIMREVCGLDPTVELDGENDVARKLMTSEGNQRLRAYLDAKPPRTELARRKILSAFLSKFAVDELIEQEISLPGWNQAMIDELTDNYDQDVEEISRIPGVTVLMT
jgi:hypothetical protein